MRQGVTLEQINAKTRIPLKILQALENDDLAPISSAFFYKSFVRQIAEHLQLPQDDLAAAIQDTARQFPEPRMPGQVISPERSTPTPKVAALTPARPRKMRWVYSVFSLIVMMVACSAIHAIWQNSRSEISRPPMLKPVARHLHAAPASVRVPRLPAGTQMPRVAVGAIDTVTKLGSLQET